MINQEVVVKNLLGHEVRIIDNEYFVALDIMKILERVTQSGSWCGSRRKIQRHMNYDNNFKFIQKNILISKSNGTVCHSDVYVIHESRIKQILFILKPSIQSNNYTNRLNIWKALYELF